MNLVHFADIAGRRYAIPDEVLAKHEVQGDLPDDQRLTGLEFDPTEGRAGADVEGYVWRMQKTDDGKALEYAVSAADPSVSQQTQSRVLKLPGATVLIREDQITILTNAQSERRS